MAILDRKKQYNTIANMIIWKPIRALIARSVEVIFLMVAGALAFTWYIEWGNPAFESELTPYERPLRMAFWVLLIAHHILRASQHSKAEIAQEPSPRVSGASVALLTGLAATTYVALPSGANDPALAAVIFVGTLVTVAAIWQFATANAAEIGEARFAGRPIQGQISDRS